MNNYQRETAKKLIININRYNETINPPNPFNQTGYNWIGSMVAFYIAPGDYIALVNEAFYPLAGQ